MPTKRKPMTGLKAIIDGQVAITGADEGPFFDALQREIDRAERAICDQIERQVFSPTSWGRTRSPFLKWDADATVAPRFTAVQRAVQRRYRRVRRAVAEPRRRVREAAYVLRHGPREDWD